MPRRPLHFLRTRSRRARVTAGVVALAVAAGAVAAWQLDGGGGDPSTVALTSGGCGRGWSAPGSGTTTFTVRNDTTSTADVALSDGGSGIVAEIPTLGPDVVRPIRVTLEPGRYQWRCVSVDGEFTFSPAEQVGGQRVPDPSPAYTPAVADDLSAAAITYRASAAQGLNVLATDTDTLDRAVKSGNRALAKQDWLAAHLQYERLGAVYDTFGNFNDEINGRADGLVGGVHSPKFTGFLRLEYGLWHDQPQATLSSVADTLDQDVHALVKAFPGQLLPVTDVPLRAHEIIENALEFELTGDTDEGSHTNLATVRANVDGDRTVLSALRPLVMARDPELYSTAEAQLTTLANQLDAYRSPAGVWTPVESLTLAQHQQLDADTDAALATLDQFPAILEQASGDSS
jgi:iron uptake system EfeUOB component EfeO/EfeM